MDPEGNRQLSIVSMSTVAHGNYKKSNFQMKWVFVSESTCVFYLMCTICRKRRKEIDMNFMTPYHCKIDVFHLYKIASIFLSIDQTVSI